MAFEEEFDIEIPDDAAENIQTVGDAMKFIEAQAERCSHARRCSVPTAATPDRSAPRREDA